MSQHFTDEDRKRQRDMERRLARATCDPRKDPHIAADRIRRVYGIEPGEWGCPGCGTIYEVTDYPSSFCTACRAYLPRRCVSPGCDGVCLPVKYREWRGKLSYYPPHHLCEDCQSSASRERRLASLPDALHRKHPKRGAWERLLSFAGKNFWQKEQRQDAQRRLSEWLHGELRPPFVVLHGPPGTGKSVLATKTVVAAIANGLRQSCYYTSMDHIRTIGSRYGEEKDAEVDRIGGAPLLLFDELGSWPSDKLTRGQLDTVVSILMRRFDEGLPTIAVTNRQDLSGWLGVHEGLDSRLKLGGGTSRYIEVKGENLRAGEQ